MDALPSRLGRFRILREIGRGGMGVVYLGVDPDLGRSVALKVLPPEFSEDPERRSRLEQEARLLAALQHPSIATIHGLERTDEGARLLVLEYVEGETLREALRRGPLPLRDAIETCTQIARALEAAHGRGVIHRDLKPDNVRLTPDGQAKVLDFGLARREAPAADANVAEAGAAEDTATSEMGTESLGEAVRRGAAARDAGLVGTAGYMSPEQVRGEPHDRRVDIFAFGCVLFECLTGTAAFPGRSLLERLAAVLERSPDSAAIPEGAPSKLRALLALCLEKDLTRRLAEMRDARIALEAIAADRDSVPLPEIAPSDGPHNLPSSLSSFVGRARECAEIRGALAQSSLVTLTGVGGCGKTRIALEVAASARSSFRDGVWWVDLAVITDADQVTAAVASVFAVQEAPGGTLRAQLIERLKPQSVLLVLDNCEHLLTQLAALAHEILAGCAGVTILATSREGLGVPGETIWRVPSLSLSAAPGGEPPEAIQLFVERARAVSAPFRLDAGNAGTIERICRRLDGIPLAIELAAARVRVLSVEQIESKLDDRFRLLTGGSRTALERHQTLHAAIAWSYELLSDEEKRCLRALSVFVGGCTLAAATSVCGYGDDEYALLDPLAHLVDKSLVAVLEGERPRYQLLESIRQFAHGELDRAGETRETRDRHAAHFRGLGRQLAAGQGRPAAERIDRIEADHENFLAAIRWLADSPATADAALALCSDLWSFWSHRGHLSLGFAMFREVLARPGITELSADRARGLHNAGFLAQQQGRNLVAREFHEESLRIARALGDRTEIAVALLGVCHHAMAEGDYARAEALGAEGLALARETGASRSELNFCNLLGNVAWFRGDAQEARARYEESLELARALDLPTAEASITSNLGAVFTQLGEYATARSHFERALAVHRRLGARLAIAQSSCNLAEALGALGLVDEAVALYGESIGLFRELESLDGLMVTLGGLATLESSRGDLDSAIARFTEALAISREIGDGLRGAVIEGSLAGIEVRRGDLTSARVRLGRALEALLASASLGQIATPLEGAAALAVALGEHPRAAGYLHAVELLQAEISEAPWAGGADERAATWRAIRETLDAPSLERIEADVRARGWRPLVADAVRWTTASV